MRGTPMTILTPALLASALGTACLARVDVAKVLQELPRDAAQQRFERLATSPACQQELLHDDAECWDRLRDADVVVETGVSRSLHGYLTSPYTVQTHLKVRLLSSTTAEPEVYYFADGGNGGLESREGYGAADGRINVFCATAPGELADTHLDSNHRVQQAQVDAVARCVHQSVLADARFGGRVKACLREVRAQPAQVAMTPSDVASRGVPMVDTAQDR